MKDDKVNGHKMLFPLIFLPLSSDKDITPGQIRPHFFYLILFSSSSSLSSLSSLEVSAAVAAAPENTFSAKIYPGTASSSHPHLLPSPPNAATISFFLLLLSLPLSPLTVSTVAPPGNFHFCSHLLPPPFSSVFFSRRACTSPLRSSLSSGHSSPPAPQLSLGQSSVADLPLSRSVFLLYLSFLFFSLLYYRSYHSSLPRCPISTPLTLLATNRGSGTTTEAATLPLSLFFFFLSSRKLTCRLSLLLNFSLLLVKIFIFS